MTNLLFTGCLLLVVFFFLGHVKRGWLNIALWILLVYLHLVLEYYLYPDCCLDCVYTYLRSKHDASQTTSRCGLADLITCCLQRVYTLLCDPYYKCLSGIVTITAEQKILHPVFFAEPVFFFFPLIRMNPFCVVGLLQNVVHVWI